MAEGAFNPINLISFQDPLAALKLQQQQAMAAQLMADSEPRKDINALAGSGPYAQIIPYSPLEGLSKAVERGMGGYMQGQSTAALAKALQGPTQGDLMGNATNGAIGSEGGMGPATKDDVASKYQQQVANALNGNQQSAANIMKYAQANAMSPGLGNEMFKRDSAGAIKAAETQNTPYVTPQGTYVMGSHLNGDAPATSGAGAYLPPSLQNSSQPQRASAAVPQIQQDKAINDVFGGSEDASTKPVVLTDNSGKDVSQNVPMASDGKPLLPNMTNIPPPDLTGTPKFNTENTKTGVTQTEQDIKDSAEGNKAFSTTAQSLGQEKARLDNLIQVYKEVQSGTMTAQNTELMNKLVGLGVITDPSEIKNIAGVQNATQNHILQVIQQIKDTNQSAGGGAPTRTFGSEISQLLENGESSKGQPEALWNVIGQAKGLVDHHLDMVNGWVKSGGLGNRMAAGYTMRPDDYATQFSTSHNISDYRDRALKDMGPFKGMTGNTGTNTPIPKTGFVSKGYQFLGGDPSKPESWSKQP